MAFENGRLVLENEPTGSEMRVRGLKTGGRGREWVSGAKVDGLDSEVGWTCVQIVRAFGSNLEENIELNARTGVRWGEHTRNIKPLPSPALVLLVPAAVVFVKCCWQSRSLCLPRAFHVPEWMPHRCPDSYILIHVAVGILESCTSTMCRATVFWDILLFPS